MIAKKNLPWLIGIIAVIGFTINFLLKGNYEFLVYAAVLFFLIGIAARTDKIFHYSSFAKWSFITWLFLHMLGGAVYINGTRLYDTILINIVGAPYYVLKYDQVIHGFCYFVITLFIYSVVLYLAKPKTSKLLVMFIAFTASMGISALNEIVELSAVIFFHSEAAVGDYYNNALDLVFNAIGSIIALLFTNPRRK